MLRSLPVSAVLFAILASLGCTSTGASSVASANGNAPSTPAPASAPASPTERVLAALQTRDRIVRIYADHGALAVSVADDAGNVVADRVTLEGLRAIDPFLYEACTNALVRNGQGGTYVDARFYPDDVNR